MKFNETSCTINTEDSSAPYHGNWPAYHRQNERFTLAAPRRSSSSLSMAGDPSDRPMQRYLQDPFHPFVVRTDEPPDMPPFSNVPVAPLPFAYSEASLLAMRLRYPSPSSSGFSNGHIESSYSETPSWSSPSMSVAAYSPEAIGGSGHFVAPHDVLHYADAQSDDGAYAEEVAGYPPFAQEGYHPMQQYDGHLEEHTPVVHSQQYNSYEMDVSLADEVARASVRHGRPQVSRAVTSPQLVTRVNRRPAGRRRATSVQGDDTTKTRVFLCPFAIYGCISTFTTKNEWKRHVATQHMRLGYWRCDQCALTDRKLNDFNRKDLFIQHVKRMHSDMKSQAAQSKSKKRSNSRSCKDNAEELANVEMLMRCYRRSRMPPERSCCLFCNQTFYGKDSWDDRMEHIGKHMDVMKKNGRGLAHPDVWNKDRDTEEYLLAECIIERRGGSLVLVEERR